MQMNAKAILPSIDAELQRHNLTPEHYAAARRLALIRALARIMGIAPITLIEVLRLNSVESEVQ